MFKSTSLVKKLVDLFYTGPDWIGKNFFFTGLDFTDWRSPVPKFLTGIPITGPTISHFSFSSKE